MAIPSIAIDPNLTKIRDLGSGSFGQVGLYQRHVPGSAPELVAVKCLPIKSDSNYYAMLKREVRSHCLLNHPHVILFKRLGLTEDRRFLYMMMEYADYGDLFKYLQRRGRLSESDARWFFQQIVLGLDYCHRRGVVNRDLKLENLLLRSAAEVPPPPGQPEEPRNLHIKVADFGLCKTAVTSVPKSRVGTLYYMAPEVMNASASRPYNAQLSDIWSLGCILYVLLFRAYPFGTFTNNDSRREVIRRIAAAEWRLPPGAPISAAALDLLRRILVADPGQRATMAHIMAHPWFLQELPPGALEFNAGLVEEQEQEPPRCEQSLEEVDAILRMAEEEPPPYMGGLAGGAAAVAGGFIGDSGIDTEIDALHDEHPSLFEPGGI